MKTLHPAMKARANAVKVAHAHLVKTVPGFLGTHPRVRIAATQAHASKMLKPMK